MSEENVSLFELLDSAIGSPQKAAVNFSALHALLNAVLRQLDIREMKTPWRDTPPGDRHPEALVGVTVPKQDHHTEEEQLQVQKYISTAEQEVQPGTELQERIAPSSSPTPPSSPAADGQWRLLSRIQTCEDGVSKVMKLIQDLHKQKDNLKEEMKALRHQQKVEAETVSDVGKCCHRVDALEETVRSLRDTIQKYPEELSQCVPWDVMQSSLLSNRENLQELVNSGGVDPATVVKPTSPPLNSNITAVNTAPSHTSTPSSPHPVEATGGPAAPSSPAISGQISMNAQMATEAPSVLSGPPQTVLSRPPQTVLSGPTQTGPTAAGMPLTQEASVPECYSEMVEALRNVSKLKERFNKLEARVAALKEGKVDQSQLTNLKELITNKGSRDSSNNLMDQLNQQRAQIDSLMSDREKLDSLEDMFMNLTSQARETTSEAPSRSEESDSKASHELRQQMSYLRKSVQRLEEDMKQLKAKQALSVERTTDRDLQDQNMELVNDVQEAILQLQAEFEKLHETTKCLHDDNRRKQSHIKELYKMMEELERKKADKQMVESEIKKADKSALESKVSRRQFDSATEQLSAMFHELLNKVTGQEQDWHKVIERLSTEMECKLNRIELDSVKKQLENRWKNIHEKLQAQGAPEHKDAAGIRKQLVDRFHCLSCDRPVVMHTSGQHLVKLASSPGFPSHKSIRPFTVYALEQFRQHYRSERISEMADYSHLAMSRSCGGSHTVTSSSQRRTGLQYIKHQTQTEVDGVIQSEEVDIVGLDGHIYKGRLNVPAIRNTETKLPTISTKDAAGMCKTKDKPKSSLSHKPAASPEVGHPVHHPHSAKSAQCSRSASSSSGRDWPVSALGCTSQSSITAATAESNT